MSGETPFGGRGFPRGWFLVAFSGELGPGEVKPVRYFDRALVLFRTESGRVVVLDGFCPHLGAHLGQGGEVEGETIVCPFHGWKFDFRGRCVEIPHARGIPSRFHTTAWPVQERSGLVFLHYDPHGKPPDWEIVPPAGWGDRGRGEWRWERARVEAGPHTVAETVARTARFLSPFDEGRWGGLETRFEGHEASQIAFARREREPMGRETRAAVRVTFCGPAVRLVEVGATPGGRAVLAHTPIDGNRLELRFGAWGECGGGAGGPSTGDGRIVRRIGAEFLRSEAGGEPPGGRTLSGACESGVSNPVFEAEWRRWYSQFVDLTT